MRPSAQGDGTSVRILVDGTEIFAAEVGGASGQEALEYEALATVEKGSAIDFAVTPGADLDINFDATVFTAIIQPL
jgi:hypothetical protein